MQPPAAATRQGHQPVLSRLRPDRWDLSAADLVQLSLRRGEREWFVRWLKSHLRRPRRRGPRRQAVALSV